jgi:hypothetical protein
MVGALRPGLTAARRHALPLVKEASDNLEHRCN